MRNLNRTCITALTIIVVFVGCGKNTQETADNSNAAPEVSASTPDKSIFEAAFKGDLETVKVHIAAGTNINQKDPNPAGGKILLLVWQLLLATQMSPRL